MDDLDLHKEIDNDTGLRSKGRLLIIFSSILLALEVSGARAIEANTFLVKLEFTNGDGIKWLLALTIIFLMVRYYNYARKYQLKLTYVWADRVVSKHFKYDNLTQEFHGICDELAPVEFDTAKFHDDKTSFNIEYIWSPLFKRALLYKWELFDDGNDYTPNWQVIPIKLSAFSSKYWKLLADEFSTQIKSYFISRESLDIQAPYLISSLAILSFIDKFLA